MIRSPRLFAVLLVASATAGRGAPARAQPLRVISQDTFGGAEDDAATGLLPTRDGGYVLVGKTRSLVPGEWDALILKTDGSGEVAWETPFGGVDEDYAYAVVEHPDGGYLVAGETRSFGAGDFDGFLIRLDDAGSLDWQKSYGGPGYDYCVDLQPTNPVGGHLRGRSR